MTLTNYIARSLSGLLLIGMLAACSDDNDGNKEPEPRGVHPTTSFATIQLNEVITGDGAPVNSTRTYAYKSGSLFSYTSKQSFFSGEAMEMESTTTVAYGDHQAIVTDDTNNVFTYTLNDYGYATECTLQEAGGNTRTYTFSYLVNTENKHYLTNITERLGDGKVYSSIDIDFGNYRALRITLHIGGADYTSTALTSPDNEIANLSEIPNLYISELYPISMHSVALYGKILGEPYDYLITQIIPDSDGTSSETTTYTYTLDNRGIVTSCHQLIESINGAGALQKYNRTVNYTIK